MRNLVWHSKQKRKKEFCLKKTICYLKKNMKKQWKNLKKLTTFSFQSMGNFQRSKQKQKNSRWKEMCGKEDKQCEGDNDCNVIGCKVKKKTGKNKVNTQSV